MRTPICDFVHEYAERDAMRLHMPGHKGSPQLGAEPWDITEIDGADNLYDPRGIILQSEQNAGSLFGCDTFYSTEGSSQSIRAMLYLTVLYAKAKGRKPLVAAVRNVHKAFVDAAALLDFDVEWLYPKQQCAYTSAVLSAAEWETALRDMTDRPTALYITTPDYLGNLTDIQALAAVCRRYGVLLLVDNAHGAYLKFLTPSRHPVDLGADLCCDSAHKTLPVLTGGAYLHVAHGVDSFFKAHAKQAMSLFGSTSPSYLILQSLDKANRYLAEEYAERLSRFIPLVQQTKDTLQACGYSLCGEEPLKLVVNAKVYGYTGVELSDLLAAHGIVCEFADRDFLVLMLTPEIDDLKRLENAMRLIPQKAALAEPMPTFHQCERVLSVREATFSARETVAASESVGRVLASATVSCPPAVPIAVRGERIDAATVQCFSYYGITHCDVVV